MPKVFFEVSTEMETFKSNRSFCNFYPNLPKTSYIHKMNKNKAQAYLKLKFASKINYFLILHKLAQNILQFQNEDN